MFTTSFLQCTTSSRLSSGGRVHLATTISFCMACSYRLEEPEGPGRDQPAPTLEDLTEAFSSYTHLKGVMSWCLRFVYNCRSTHSVRTHSSKLSLRELQETETRLLQLSQGRSSRLSTPRFSPRVKSHDGAVYHISDPIWTK